MMVFVTVGKRELPVGTRGELLHEGKSGTAKIKFGARIEYMSRNEYSATCPTCGDVAERCPSGRPR